MSLFTSTLGAIGSAKDISAFTGPQLVTLYNELTGKQTKKFASVAKGAEQTLKALKVWQSQQPDGASKGGEIADPEDRTYRKDSGRGRIIELASVAGGASFGELKSATKWKDQQIKAAIIRIKGYNGLSVETTGDGDEARVVISGILRTRKAFSFEPKKEQKDHKPGTKRAAVVELLRSDKGATFEQIQQATGWDDRTAYEGIRLIHGYLGYGIRETAEGCIQLYT